MKNTWKNKKRAITFAELMISLVVISVIAALLYPMIAQFTPNVNKPLFKAAYSTLSTVLAEITNTTADGKLPDTLCQSFCKKANTIEDSTDCTDLCNDNDNVLTTTNGMRWKFNKNDNYSSPEYSASSETFQNVFQIIVDVNASREKIEKTALEAVKSYVENGYKKIIYIPNKIFNIVV